jgi:probable F420-dependent oxidoreductase
MTLPFTNEIKVGIMGTAMTRDSVLASARLAEELGYDSVWRGDHLSFAIPIMDPLVQMTMVTAMSDKLTVGTAVYLLPLRHPGPVAKQVSTLDVLSGGKLIFGVGVGGEFESDFRVAGVPIKERGARLDEGIEVLRKLWTGEKITHKGRFFDLEDVQMLPTPIQAGGPPIWCGGRSEAALHRAGALCDGYISYVVTPDMFAEAMEQAARAHDASGRNLQEYGTAHLLFARVDDDYDTAFKAANDHLSERYAMDFSKATKRYAAIGRPEDVAEAIAKFIDAGVRHFVMDFVGPLEDRPQQIHRFAEDVRPLLASIL